MNGRAVGDGRSDLVATSLRVISAGQAASGAFVASPTFSQYGYSWLRDGTFIAEALDLVGRIESSARFHHWVAGVVVSSAVGLERAMASARSGQIPSADDYLHCRYHLDGSPADTDWPTFQLDGPGIWLWGLAHHLRHGGQMTAELQRVVLLVSRYLADLWTMPCADAWEEFSEHVHTSTLAAIKAGLAAAVSVVPALGDEPKIEQARSSIDARMSGSGGSFTKWSGGDEVDASLLWMVAPYETLAPDEPRFAATLARIEAELISDGGGAHRYRADTYYGGGAWPVLTAAYGRVLLRRGAQGDTERAIAALRWIEAQADDDGWLPEQVATNALAPDRIAEWRELWGESARPLLWSHASYLALRTELEARAGESLERA
ncbi:MAG: glycoside hydrolase family 15 protein [Chloroflexota bacterium]